MGLVVLQSVGSSLIRDQTYVSCVGRQILYHRATRDALMPELVIVTVGSVGLPVILCSL